MFNEYSDSDDETPDYSGYDGYRGSSEKNKKKVKKLTKEEEEDEPAPVEEHDDDDAPKAADAADLPDQEDEYIEYSTSVHSNPYATYRKVHKYIAPEDNMTSDRISRYDYADLVSKETQRIESSGYTFIDPGTLDRADLIAEATINALKCPYKILRKVGHEIDHQAKIVYELMEVHDPNQMMRSKLNATTML